MQTLQQIEADLLTEIDGYVLPDRTKVKGLVGVPWSREHYLAEIEVLRGCLVRPYWCSVRAGEPIGALVGDQSSIRTFAVVAKDPDSYYHLLFAPEAKTYALGWADDEGNISTFMYGDAVSTFLAR